jgi:uncharacterized small protein (TIGR04563 family)
MNTASEKIEQRVHLPMAMHQDLVKQAQRLDRSLSWCAQRAWTIARTEISKVDDEHPIAQHVFAARYASNDTNQNHKQMLFFPSDMLAEIKAQAEQQNRSISWLVQHAWCIAASEIEKTPAS